MGYFDIIQRGLTGYWTADGSLPFLRPLMLFVTVVLAYLLGSVNFGVIVSRIVYQDDVRTHGSGNAGANNMLRTYGVKASLLTFLGDFLKGALGAALGLFLWGYIGGYAAALFCVFGHAFPLYFRFQGGKGVATAAGAVLILNSHVFLLLIIIFIGLVAVSKYVSLGSIMAAALLPLLVSRMGAVGGLLIGYANTPLSSGLCSVMAFLIGGLVVVLHRKNLVRLWKHQETKLSLPGKSGSAGEEK